MALNLFSPQEVADSMSILDARLLDLWRGADDATKQKIIRILSELV